MPQIPSSHPAKRLYDDRAATYEKSWHPSFARTFVHLAGLSPGQNVLDLACGTGLVTALASSAVGPDGSVIGVDASSGMLSVACEKKAQDDAAWQNVMLLEGDVLHLDDLAEVRERKGSFDVITMASALVLMPDPVAAARHFHDYLATGGKLVVDSTHPKNLLGGAVLEAVARQMGVSIPYYRSWSQSAASLRTVLEDAKFQVESVTPVQQAGYGTRYHSASAATADREFDKFLSSPVLHGFQAADRVDEARALFRHEWASRADPAGQVAEVDQVFVAVARKPSPSHLVVGGCRCGAIIYVSANLPSEVSWCHCRTCQKLSGSGSMAFIMVPTDGFSLEGGDALRTIKLSERAERAFCGLCGTPVWMRYSDGITCIVLGSVDQMVESVDALRKKGLKSTHIFLREMADWETVLPEDGAGRFLGFSDE